MAFFLALFFHEKKYVHSPRIRSHPAAPRLAGGQDEDEDDGAASMSPSASPSFSDGCVLGDAEEIFWGAGTGSRTWDDPSITIIIQKKIWFLTG